MWTFERIFPPDCWIISPQAPTADAQGGFSWWPMEAGSRDKVLVEPAAQTLGNFLEATERYYGITPSARIAIGFSQGAAILSVLAHSAFGESLTGMGLLAGFVLEDESKPLAVRDFFVGHGTKDETVSISKAKRGIEYLERRGARVASGFDDVGHKVGSNATRGLKEWVSGLVSPESLTLIS